MINLANGLTLHFVWLIHNFQDKIVDLRFRCLPTMGSVVQTTMEDWIEISVCIGSVNPSYSVVIGKSKDELWSMIINEWNKFKSGTVYEGALTTLFEYIDSVGIV